VYTERGKRISTGCTGITGSEKNPRDRQGFVRASRFSSPVVPESPVDLSGVGARIAESSRKKGARMSVSQLRLLL
jgi:hypothetical protein